MLSSSLLSCAPQVPLFSSAGQEFNQHKGTKLTVSIATRPDAAKFAGGRGRGRGR